MAHTSKYFGKHAIKVGKHIKPLTLKERLVPKLEVGKTYFINFQDNLVYEVILQTEIQETYGMQYRFLLSDRHKGGYGVSQVLYDCEVGSTPEEAVMNRVGCNPTVMVYSN